MGLEDRDWYREEKRQERKKQWAQEARTKQQPKKTASQWNAAPDDLDTKSIILWLSIAVNVMLAMALLYVT